jgi:hypothetical protein
VDVGIVRELGFGKSRAGAKAADVYTATTRAELRGAVQEADNWLTKEYPKLVAEMEGGVRRRSCQGPLRRPRAAGTPGTKTLTARKRLTDCATDLDALDASETQHGQRGWVLRCSSAQRRRRSSCLTSTGSTGETSTRALEQDTNVKTLDFESDDVPLWRRIRRASLLRLVRAASGGADFGRGRCRWRRRVRQEVSWRCMDSPSALFTLSLEKIAHILDGARGAGSGDPWVQPRVVQIN